MTEFRPIGTWAVLAIIIVVFVAFGLMNPTPVTALRAGAQDSLLVASGEGWRLVSSIFMHFGLMHILFNGFFLTRIGPMLELELGTERYLLVFLLSGLGGSTAAALVYEPGMLMGGASGGLFGMLGALLAVWTREERSYGNALRDNRVRGVLGLIALNVLIGFLVPQISQTGHLGGLITGFLVTLLWLKLPDARGRARRPPVLPALALLVLIGAAVWTALEPVHRDWYRAREWWFAAEPHRADMRASLEASGTDPKSLTFLAAIRDLRNREAVQPDDPALLRFLLLARQGDYRSVSELGVDPSVFNPLLDVFREQKTLTFDTRGTVPADPWLASRR